MAAEFGGMDGSLMARMKELEEENKRLKKMYAEERLKAISLPRRSQKSVAPSQRREMARWVIDQGRATISLACLVFGISQTCFHYEAKLNTENEVIANWLVRLTTNQRNWGFGLCFLYLRNVKGFQGSHKRVDRIYRALELNLRIKPGKRLVCERPLPLSVPTAINQI